MTRYAEGRRGKHRLEHLPYAVVGEFDRPVVLLRKDRHEHPGGFGIESSYRLGNALRPRTTSRSPKVRLLLIGLAAILVNSKSLVDVWVWLEWAAAGVPQLGPGGRAVRQALLRLTRLHTFLTLAIQAVHGVVLATRRPSSGQSTRTRLIGHRKLAFAEY
ncbi:MAG: hypothetical protein EPO21_07635 [Chloroflexota bacterium]|nr:MAG: hypothetical protein EPO21_07635 [Chloroflexota bacterium]